MKNEKLKVERLVERQIGEVGYHENPKPASVKWQICEVNCDFNWTFQFNLIQLDGFEVWKVHPVLDFPK